MAFKVIKVKANFIFVNIYYIAIKIIQDLKNTFVKFDKVAKLNSFLHDFEFGITITNYKQIFNTFFITFTLVIILLNFTNWYKILNF